MCERCGQVGCDCAAFDELVGRADTKIITIVWSDDSVEIEASAGFTNAEVFWLLHKAAQLTLDEDADDED